jgi:TonB-dependent SusC/RagA subfamily outer membrane receptor
MEPDTDALDESVVIAYGQQKKVTITGAVSAVSGEGLMKSPVPNVANALQGNLPGVSAVQPSGMPGADEPVIRIRGVGSLNSAEPLVLVDGVERSFSQLDANEIESISVLKDASATAVFGVRGANGVILVTTKRGTTGKASVYASFGYLNNNGIIRGADMQRYTARLKTDYQAKNWLRVGMNMGYTNFNWNNGNSSEGSAGSTGNIFAAAASIAPIYPLYIRDGEGNILKDSHGYLRYDYGDGANG